MNTYREESYGEQIADVYDEWHSGYEEATITTLCALAREERLLELGIGTGRIALPLQRRGLVVHGIEASPAMIAKLRAKADGAQMPVTLGNMADVAVAGHYGVIYVLSNTFFGLLTQDEQLRCLENVTRHLTPDGCFVLEAFIPDLARFQGGQSLRTARVDLDGIRFDASQIDPISQQIMTQHLVINGQEIRLYPVKLRYVWPAELDLMARIAGLRLKHRWRDWHKTPFGPGSDRHVSVYERAM